MASACGPASAPSSTTFSELTTKAPRLTAWGLSSFPNLLMVLLVLRDRMGGWSRRVEPVLPDDANLKEVENLLFTRERRSVLGDQPSGSCARWTEIELVLQEAGPGRKWVDRARLTLRPARTTFTARAFIRAK